MPERHVLTITAFLLARIAEDERAAETAAKMYDDESAEYSWLGGLVAGLEDAGWPAGAVRRVDSHIARWDPARVLAECEAKRRIVDQHRDVFGDCSECSCCRVVRWPCPTLRLLAQPHRDHPDFQVQWTVQ